MRPEQREQIVESIQQEENFPKEDLGAQEDELFFRLSELIEEGVLTATEAEQCFHDWQRVFYYEGR